MPADTLAAHGILSATKGDRSLPAIPREREEKYS